MSHRKISIYASRSVAVTLVAIAMVVAALLPALLSSSVSADQLIDRKIVLGGDQSGTPSSGASAASQTDVTYSVYFTTATTSNVGGLVIDFCSNSPIIGTSCTAPTGFDANSAGLALANMTGVTDWAVDGANSDANTLVLTRTAASVAASTLVDLDLGSTGGSDGITNPSQACGGGSPEDKCSFYARILTFATTAGAQAYTSTVPGTHVDSGGVAMSTANQLTITARVQEVLQFCVGTTDAATENDCEDISGTSIDLGVVDPSAVAVSADAAGLAMVRTNAVDGVTIDYFSEQDTSSGALKVAGQACTGDETVASGSTTDQCFNSAGATALAFIAGTESFGMTSTAVDTTNGTTTSLTRDAQYDNNTEYAWDGTGAFDRIASSSTVVDDEMLNLKFAASAAPTTPTGSYTVTATFVATGQF